MEDKNNYNKIESIRDGNNIKYRESTMMKYYLRLKKTPRRILNGINKKLNSIAEDFNRIVGGPDD